MQYSASNPVGTELYILHFVMVITVLWAELCGLWLCVDLSSGIVHLVIHINLTRISYEFKEYFVVVQK